MRSTTIIDALQPPSYVRSENNIHKYKQIKNERIHNFDLNSWGIRMVTGRAEKDEGACSKHDFYKATSFNFNISNIQGGVELKS